MEKLKMAICDKEEGFIRKLYEYILLTEGETYDVSLFTEEEAIKEYLDETYVNILVLSDGFDESELNLENVESVVRLTGEKALVKEGVTIYKYRKRDELLHSITEIYINSAGEKRSITCEKGLKVIGVYSPIKRCFQTSFSLTYGQILAKSHKTLYIGFENFSGFDTMLSRITRLNIIDLLYFLECDENDFSMRIKSVVERIGDLHYIPPARSFLEFKDVDTGNWEKLIKAIDEKTDYEYLILDMSEHVMGLFDILQGCEKVFTITDESRISDAKIAQYLSILKETAYEKVIEKTQRLKIPVFYDIPSEYELLPLSELASFIRKKVMLKEGIYVGI